MNRISDNKGNIFGALKLIEQLYLDGHIPSHIYNNIIKEYAEDIDSLHFVCDQRPEQDGGEQCTE